MLKFIHEEYRRDITLADIAGTAGLSKSECCRCFQRMINSSPFEYLISRRIYMAAKRISESNMPIGAAAKSVGFHGSSYFYKKFKSIMGMTPSKYRQQYKQKNGRFHKSG